MSSAVRARAQSWRQIYFNIATIPYWAVHVGTVVGIAMLGWSWTGFAFAMGLYAIRMFFVTAAYHRYFSHRSFKTSRPMQLVFALGATLAVQKGVLWWAAHHREHHRQSDREQDIHSPVIAGFWWSHMGWFMCRDLEATDMNRVRDLAKYRELVWLNKVGVLPPVLLGALLAWLGGGYLLTWYLFSTVLVWHGTFTINSLAHIIGKRRYKTTDQSKNHWLLALITLGEGWHNNHHHYQASCRQGFRWYEFDITYYVLRLMSVVGLVWDLKAPPRHVVENRPKPNRVAAVSRSDDAPSIQKAA